MGGNGVCARCAATSAVPRLCAAARCDVLYTLFCTLYLYCSELVGPPKPNGPSSAQERCRGGRRAFVIWVTQTIAELYTPQARVLGIGPPGARGESASNEGGATERTGGDCFSATHLRLLTRTYMPQFNSVCLGTATPPHHRRAPSSALDTRRPKKTKEVKNETDRRNKGAPCMHALAMLRAQRTARLLRCLPLPYSLPCVALAAQDSHWLREGRAAFALLRHTPHH